MAEADLRSIHLVGICGTGMGSFAGLLKAAGHSVRGSDENVYPPMSDKLAEWGIAVQSGYRPENLVPRPDLVVIGNVIKRVNPEAQAVIAAGMPYTSFAKCLGDLFLADKHSVVISGTHGKTTTTSLVAWLLTSAGRDPGLLVGGVPVNFKEGFRLGKGPHFVVEGDEYDTAYFDKVPKFLHYRPRSLIITSIEYDHADIYPDVESIEREFEKLIDLVPSEGKIIACASSPRVLPRLKRAKAPIETYTARPGVDATWRAEQVGLTQKGPTFSAVFRGQSRGQFRSTLAGLHNVENALAAVAMGFSLGLTEAEVRSGLESFQGVARRQELRAEIGGISIVDDFAHHPTAVRETIIAVRARHQSGRLFAIFEPRSATSSRRYFQEAYAEAFDGADRAIIAQVGKAGINSAEKLDVALLVAEIEKRGHSASSAESVEAIVETLVAESRPGDTLLFMSNGGFGGILVKMEQALRARERT